MPDCPTCFTPLETRGTRTFCPACMLREMWVEEEEPALEESEIEETPCDMPKVPRFKLWNKIGEGGFAIVYRAEQLEPVRREVALKVLKPEVSSNDVLARFEAERQTLARMEHPGIARLWDAGQTEQGQPYFAMELVRGVPITTYCKSHELGLRERLELFIEACAAVQHAHEKGVLHRDIKPANLLVAEVNELRQVKVIDFGIAKALEVEPGSAPGFRTAIHQAIGTPGYMSPEQAEWGSQQVDARSDIYALGVVLYELLTGSTPLEIERKSSEVAKRRAVAGHAKAPSSQPTTVMRNRNQRRDLDAITLKALEHDSSQRYASAAALADDVSRHLGDQPVEAASQPWTYVITKFARRHRGLVSIGAVALLAIIGGATASMFLYLKEQQAHDQADAALAQVEAQQKSLRHALGQSHFAAAQRFKTEGDNESAVLSLSRAVESDPSLTVAADDLQMLLAYSDFLQPLAAPIPLQPEWGKVEHSAVAISGHEIAAHLTGNGNGEVLVIWQNTDDGWETKVLPLKETIYKMSLSGPGTVLGVVETRTLVRLYSTATAEELRQWECPVPVTYLGLNIHEKPSAIIGGNDGSVWELPSDTQLPPRQIAHVQGAVKEIMFVPSQQTIVVGGSTGVVRRWRVWDNSEGEVLLRMPGQITALAQAQSGNLVAAGDSLGYVNYFRSSSPQATPEPLKLHESMVNTLALSVPNPVQIARQAGSTTSAEAPSMVSSGQDLMVRWRNLESGANIVPPMESAGWVMRAFFSRDGQEVTLISKDSSVRLWRRGDTNPHELRKPQHASLAADGGGGRCLLAKRDDGRAMEVLSLAQRTAVPVSLVTGGPRARSNMKLRTMAFSNGGNPLLCVDDKAVANLWDVQTANLEGEAHWDQQALASQATSEGNFLLAMADGSIWATEPKDAPPKILLDATQHPTETTLEFLRPTGKAKTASKATERLEPSQWELASISAKGDAVAWAEPNHTAIDGTWVRVYRRNTNQLQRFLAQRLSTLAVGPSGKLIAIGMGNGVVTLYDLDSQRTAQIIAHQTRITATELTADGKFLLTGSSDSTIALWDVETHTQRGSHLRVGAPVVHLCASGNAQRFACAMSGYTVVGDIPSWSMLGPRLQLPMNDGLIAMDEKGTRLAIVLINGAALVYDLPAKPSTPPPWLLQFAGGYVSRRFTEAGVVESIEHPGTPTLISLVPKDEKGPWADFARWLLSNRSGRKLSPWSNLSIEEYVENLIARGSPEALMEARRRLGVKYVKSQKEKTKTP